MNAFKQHPQTTVLGILIATCQALALIPQFVNYQYAFQGASIIFTALLGVFAADGGQQE